MAESFIDKYKSEIDKITAAVELASTSRPSMVSKDNLSIKELEHDSRSEKHKKQLNKIREDKAFLEKEKYFKKFDQAKKDVYDRKTGEIKNPYLLEVINVIRGSQANKLQPHSELNNWISDKLSDLATYITVNENQNKNSLKDNSINIISSANAAPMGGSVYSGEGPLKQLVTNTIRSYLTDEKWIADTANKYAGRAGKKISDFYEKEGKLPAYAKLAARQFVPEGKESYLDKDTEKVKTRRTYEPITDVNRKEWFGDKEVEKIAGMLRERDSDRPVMFKRSIGSIDSVDYDDEDKQIDSALGIFNYGHYDKTGKWQAGLPDLEGNYTIRDRYDWGRKYHSGINQILSLAQQALVNPSRIGRNQIEPSMQVLGPQESKGEGRDIKFTVPTYKNDPMGIMNVMSSRLGPYKDYKLSDREREFYHNYLGLPSLTTNIVDDKTDEVKSMVTPLGQGDLPGFGWQEDAFMGDMPDANEDPGYYDEDIDLRGGGQISQGLDNLYMKKRNEPKEKLYDMMGYKERQYGGGLDDAYMNRRRSSAFAAPDATSAFASPMSQGGLPTIYRYYGGTLGEFSGIEENMGGPTSEEAAGGAGGTMPDPDDWTDPANWANTGLDDPAIVTTPSAPTSDDEIDITGFPTDPNVGVFGRPLRTPEQIKSRLSGRRPEDGYTKVEYTYLNDIMDKTGMTLNQAENYLASVMATPGGIAAMEQGFHGDYTGGGPAGTLDNFVRGVGADLGLQEIAAREKRRKADPYDDFGVKERDDSFIGSIKDTVSRFFQGNRGITTEEGKEEFKEVLADKGATFIPYQESPLSGAISVGNTLFNPLSGVSSVIEFITGATPLGTIVTKEGIRLALDANYNVIPEQSIKEYDEGNVTTPVTRQKPLEKKKSTKKEEKKKDTTKKTGNTEKIKASNIDRLKSYMSLTGKDLSTSKKDLFITDISITEEDFT